MDRNKIYKISYLVIFGIVVFALLLQKFDTFKYLDIDVLWHVKVGEEIFLTRSIPMGNSFSWIEGTVWSQQEWLFDVLLYMIARFSGVIGYVFIGIFTLGLVYVIPFIKNNWRFKIISVIAFYYSFKIFKINFINRPMWYSLLILFAIMEIYESKKIDNRIKCLLYLLIGVIVSNFHAGMIVVASVLFIINIAADILLSIKTHTKIDKVTVEYSLAGFIAFLIGFCINPLGFNRFGEMFKVSALPSNKFITEWDPLTIPGALGAFILVAVVFSIGYGFSHAYRNSDVKEMRRLIVTSAYVCLAIMSVKSGAIAIIIYFAFGYKYLDKLIYDILINGTKFSKYLYTKEFTILSRKHKSLIALPLLALISILVAIPMASQTNDFDHYARYGCPGANFVDRQDSSIVREKIISESICEYLRNEAANNPNYSLLNSYGMGNYLLWEEVPVFVDTRQQPYVLGLSNTIDCTALDDLFALKNCTFEEYREFIEKYDFEYIVIGTTAPCYNTSINKYVVQDEAYELIMSDESAGNYLYRKIG